MNKKNSSYKKIIIVDDSKLGPILKEALANEKNYQTELYITGLEAITNIGEFSYFDLALVDVGLPDMDGEKVIEYLRNKYPTKPVLCITSYKDHHSRSATRTVHKGSETKISRLMELLDDFFKHSYT